MKSSFSLSRNCTELRWDESHGIAVMRWMNLTFLLSFMKTAMTSMQSVKKKKTYFIYNGAVENLVMLWLLLK